MAIIVLGKGVVLPIAPLRDFLGKHLPLFRWRIGEDDDGTPECMGPIRPHQLVMGRSEASSIFIEIKAHETRLDAPAPPHSCHLEIGRPTTEQQAIADRATLILCATLMQGDADGSRCQLAPGGNWLSLDDVGRLFQAVIAGESMAIADGLGLPPDRVGDVAAAAAADTHAGGYEGTAGAKPRAELSALIVLAERQLPVDRVSLERFARDIDPDGGWSAEEHRGQTVLVGRGTVLGVMDMSGPLPPQYLAGNWARSYWFKGDRGAVERHARHLTIKTPLDTRTADWVQIRQVAKIATLCACWIARQPGALAIVNLDVGTVFEAKDGAKFLNHIGGDELPVALWTWSNWHGLDDGNVSMSTSGLEPFLGHELETWNAPLAATEVQGAASNLIRYLLDKGPVIGHNDTAGKTPGDRSIRCFLGASRAQRPSPVQALFLEFEGEDGAVVSPKPDLPTSVEDAAKQASSAIDAALARMIENTGSPALKALMGDIREQRGAAPTPAPQPPASPIRRAGGFGRKGL